MRVSINGLPHLEQGGRMLSTNLYFGTSAMALNSSALLPVEKRVNSAPATIKLCWPALRRPGRLGSLPGGPVHANVDLEVAMNDDDEKSDEEFSNALQKYLRDLMSQGYTPEQAKAKALERLNHVGKATVKDRRNALRIVSDTPPDKRPA
jgi:hypothetical protein